ncbi:MAG: hypothetical protein AUH78_20625 [Gemmatimonadetes bacterium 13_1_40CM_4_69_8]|nr:MAG: hypothetical protein AUH78_20625 [Gemmatimonadetes bacterium 13_1_40CM_4_69_8]
MHAIRCAALSFRALIATKLGACAFCIRLSLTLSVVSWLLVVVFDALVPGSLAGKVALVPALGFTALFASHLAAYAVRVVLAYRTAGRVAPGETTASTATRRRFLVLSARTIGLALVPTVLVSKLWGSAGAAAGRADCPRPTDCLSGCCCQRCKTRLKKCDPAYLSCSYICWGSCVG